MSGLAVVLDAHIDHGEAPSIPDCRSEQVVAEYTESEVDLVGAVKSASRHVVYSRSAAV